MFKSCKRGRGLDRPGKVTVEVNFRNRVLVFLAAGKAAEKSEELVQLHTRVIGMSVASIFIALKVTIKKVSC